MFSSLGADSTDRFIDRRNLYLPPSKHGEQMYAYFDHNVRLPIGAWLGRVEHEDFTNLLRKTQKAAIESGVVGKITMGPTLWGYSDNGPKSSAIIEAVFKGGRVYLTFNPGLGLPAPVPK